MLVAPLGPAVQGGGHVEVQTLTGAGAGHVHQAAFFLKIFGPGQGMPGGEAVLHQINNEHGIPLQPLGRMHGGKGHPPLAVVALLFRRFQGQIRHKEVQLRIG